jgi:hypothetical protein
VDIPKRKNLFSFSTPIEEHFLTCVYRTQILSNQINKL